MASNHDMAFSKDSEVTGAVQRACQRRAADVHQEMKRGIYSLATIVSAAPWFGVFATVVGIATSFRSGGGERTAMVGRLADYLAVGIVPSGIGLFTSITALIIYRHLIGGLEAFDYEMAHVPTLLLQRFQPTRSQAESENRV